MITAMLYPGLGGRSGMAAVAVHVVLYNGNDICIHKFDIHVRDQSVIIEDGVL
jgi:hypothetical protein